MSLFTKIFGDDSTRALKEVKPIVEKINSLESDIKKLSDVDLRNKTDEFRKRLSAGETMDSILPEAFAVVREVALRTTGMRPFDVQLIGGIILHKGTVIEMKTGEGKTLVATMPVYLNAISGKGVHLVTVNDFLARRDTQLMGQVYDGLGLSVAVINAQNTAYIYSSVHEELDDERDEYGSFKVYEKFLKPCSRKEAYQADITYGTNNEFGFDYLRDNTQRQKEMIVQRGYNFVIVDEVDSVLIDEARVPLILSTASNEAEGVYKNFNRLAMQMDEEKDYVIDEKLKAIQITNDGISKAEKILGIENIYTSQNIKLVHHLETAIKARALYLKDRDYLVKNNEVLIVDPFTGRTQEGRRWSDGLHQAIEAKEGVQIKQESKTLASVTYQNYFKFYKKLSGMTGTAISSREEFDKTYNLLVVEIPTNLPSARIDHQDFIFQTEEGKLKAIAKKVKELQQKGQPVLLGTASVEKNEIVASYLQQAGIKHQVLNAKNHEAEGLITAQAGRKGAVTIATNMAGRGVDIKLGGSPREVELEDEIKSLGGLFVLGTERHEARRIDNQLRGRSGRQGDSGETQFYVSLEDPLMRVFGGEKVQKMIGALGIPEDEPIKNSFISKQLEKAQERIEGMHFDSRKSILEYDDVLSFHRSTVYSKRRKILFDDKDALKQAFEEVALIGADTEQKITAKRNELGTELFWGTFKNIVLYVTDRLWMEHLEVMDNTRRSVGLRGYGQLDPLVEYKKESLRLFKEMQDSKNREIAEIMSRVEVKKVQEESTVGSADIKKKEINVARDNKKTFVKKDGVTKQVKKKKLQTYIDAGWEKI